MADDFRDPKTGRMKPGHPGLFKGGPKPSDGDTDFDEALIAAARGFGSGPKVKTGVAGYAASLMASRPVEYAQLLKSALARKQSAVDSAVAAVPITVAFFPCPSNFFMPAEEARAEWAARTGAGPQLVVNNATPSDDDPDDQFDTDPDDDAA